MQYIAMKVILFLLASYFQYSFVSTTYNANYYSNLWNTTMQKLKDYERPTSNQEFMNISQTKCILSEKSYDYIIIGAGSAGCVLANRLSEHSTVLLLEAGGNETEFSMIPEANTATHLTNLNWGYFTTPQRNACLGKINRQCPYVMGKSLGGSSAVNGMVMTRGNKQDYQMWPDSWNYEDVLPYFIKSENAVYSPQDYEYHGHSGPVVISNSEVIGSVLNTIIKGNQELGNRQVDYDGRSQIGVSRWHSNIKIGQRFSTNRAYLVPALDRVNLEIKQHALVSKISFEGNEAKSVNYLHKGRCHTVEANKEIIVSAGAINSPQLLMLSGIGPKSELRRFNISTIADLPVGQNLKDHVYVINFRVRHNLTFRIPSVDEAAADYVKGKGWFTFNAFAVDFNNASIDQFGHTEIETIYSVSNVHIPSDVQRIDSHVGDVLNDFGANAHPTDIIASVALLHPKSKGSVTLKSSNIVAFPLIDPNFLTEEFDLATIYKAIRNVYKLVDTKAFKAINATVPQQKISACKDLSGKKYWYCFIKYISEAGFHPISTCKMGHDRIDSVVDPLLRVHGIKNLRVVDASVIPYTVAGHTNAVAIMLAEKSADVIKRAK